MDFQNLAKIIFAAVCCFIYFIFQVTTLSKQRNVKFEQEPKNVFYKNQVTTYDQEEGNQTVLLKKRLPDALIIGVMKGGTSMLQNFIFIHPDVKGLGKGEINFFSNLFYKGTSWYFSMLEAARDDEIVMEKSLYFHHKMASQRIWKTYGKKIKLILIVKDPVERLLSQYAMMIHYRQTRQRFSQLVYKKVNGTFAVNNASNPVLTGNYADQMALWLSSGFDLTNFLIIDGHKFAQDPWPELVKLENFLGLRHMLTKDMFYLNETKGFHCVMPNFTFVDGTPSNHKGGCGPARCGRKHQVLTDEERNLLYKFYAPKNQEFFTMVDMEFPDWDLHKNKLNETGLQKKLRVNNFPD